MRNLNNKLNLKTGTNVLVIVTTGVKENITVAIPTRQTLANAKVVEVNQDGSFTAHWKGNFNLRGDFRTELMSFNNELVLDTNDRERRNKFRKQNGLIANAL